MTWINYIKPDEATGRLKKQYEKYTRPDSRLSNIISAHSLRPHMLEGHMAFYRAILYHTANKLPLWFLEAIGVYVSHLNGCSYCVSHHTLFGGQVIADKQRWQEIVNNLTNDKPELVFDGKELALIKYAYQLTVNPKLITEEMINNIRNDGADDGEILEVNQVCGYFSYANRTVLGLGINEEGEYFADVSKL